MNIILINSIAYLCYYLVSGISFTWYYGVAAIGFVVVILLFALFFSIKHKGGWKRRGANNLLFKSKASRIYEVPVSSKSKKGDKSMKSKKQPINLDEIATKRLQQPKEEDEDEDSADDKDLFKQSSKKIIVQFGTVSQKTAKRKKSIHFAKVIPVNNSLNQPSLISAKYNEDGKDGGEDEDRRYISRNRERTKSDDLRSLQTRSYASADEFDRSWTMSLHLNPAITSANASVLSGALSGIPTRNNSIVFPSSASMRASPDLGLGGGGAVVGHENMIYQNYSPNQSIFTAADQSQYSYHPYLPTNSPPSPKNVVMASAPVTTTAPPSNTIYIQQDRYDPMGEIIPTDSMSTFGRFSPKRNIRKSYGASQSIDQPLSLTLASRRGGEADHLYSDDEKDEKVDQPHRNSISLSQSGPLARRQSYQKDDDHGSVRSSSVRGGPSSLLDLRSTASHKGLANPEEEWKYYKSLRELRKEKLKYYQENPDRIRSDMSAVSGFTDLRDDQSLTSRTMNTATKENYVHRKYSGRSRQRHYSEDGSVGPGAQAEEEKQDKKERSERNLALLMMPPDDRVTVMDMINLLPNPYQEKLNKLERRESRRHKGERYSSQSMILPDNNPNNNNKNNNRRNRDPDYDSDLDGGSR